MDINWHTSRHLTHRDHFTGTPENLEMWENLTAVREMSRKTVSCFKFGATTVFRLYFAIFRCKSFLNILDLHLSHAGTTVKSLCLKWVTQHGYVWLKESGEMSRSFNIPVEWSCCWQRVITIMLVDWLLLLLLFSTHIPAAYCFIHCLHVSLKCITTKITFSPWVTKQTSLVDHILWWPTWSDTGCAFFTFIVCTSLLSHLRCMSQKITRGFVETYLTYVSSHIDSLHLLIIHFAFCSLLLFPTHLNNVISFCLLDLW